jgi:hypothetical protein
VRVSTTEHDFPYLAARGDNTGSFLRWLDELRVPYSHTVRIGDMIRWGWLQPSFRILLPDTYFLSWKDFPADAAGSHDVSEDNVWAHHLWWAAGGASSFLYQQLPFRGNWFVHPFDRPDNEYSARITEARQATSLPPVEGKKHPNSNTYYPWIDYFPYWKAYELIDLLPSVAVTNPIWFTDRIPEQIDDIKANLDMLTRWRKSDLSRVHKTWQDDSTFFSYLARYRAMQAALTHAPRIAEVEPWEPADAARALARTLSVTSEELEELTKTKLLAQADAWRSWKERDGNGPGEVALGHLQKDLLCAIEWLYYLTGKTYDDYCDLWTMPDSRSRTGRSLSKALPVQGRVAEEYFLRHFNRVRGGYDLIPPPDKLTDDEVAKLVRALRHRTYLFADWLKRYQAFHEGLVGAPSWDWAGITEDRLFDDLALMVLFTEKVLDIAAPAGTTTGTYKSVKDLLKASTARLEATDHRFKGAWQLASTQWKAYTSLRNKPTDPFGALRTVKLNGPETPAALAKAVLFFDLGRNYFAHHSYLNQNLIQTPNGGALFAGIVTTTLYLTGPAFHIR